MSVNLGLSRQGLRLAAECCERHLDVLHDRRNRVLISSAISHNTRGKYNVHVTIKNLMKVQYPSLCYKGVWGNGLL
jgi:hypothetical protein